MDQKVHGNIHKVHIIYVYNYILCDNIAWNTEAVDMNGRFQMQGGKNWFLPK